MFDEVAAVGFIPTPMFELRAGHLYNVIVSFLVFMACIYAAWAIFYRGRKFQLEKSFAFFLLAVGVYWLVVALGNLISWFDLLAQFSVLAYLLKILSVAPLIMLAYYLCTELGADRANTLRIMFLFVLVCLGYLLTTFRFDLDQSVVSYWGVQWQIGIYSLIFYLFFLLLPLGMGAFYLILKKLIAGLLEKRTLNLTLHLGVFIFVIMEYLQVSVPVVTWPRLMARLCYILIALGAYLYFIDRVDTRGFAPRDEKLVLPKTPRISFFLRLLFHFVLLAVAPITVASLLMFVSFKEIINLYVYKPLLWNLKTSRQVFLLALNHMQIQALFLMLLMGLLVFVVSVLVSRSIAASLRNVTVGMKRVSDGDFSFKLVRESNDEIGDVVDYFNEMSNEIKRSREVMEEWSLELESKVAERTEELHVLYNVSKAIGSSLDFELLIGRAIEHLQPVLQADIYAVLVPEARGRFNMRVKRGIEIAETVINSDDGLLGEALAKGEMLISGNVAEDDRCRANIYKALGVKTLVAAPLRSKGRTLGVLLLGTKKQREYAKDREINLLATVADQLAVAMDNIDIYEKQKEAVARLTELDRLKNEFISMVSHELRTPVTTVEGYLSLFLDGTAGPLTKDQKNYLNVIRENDQRLLTLINRLLDFSKIESGRFSIKRELVSINETIHAAIESLRSQLTRKKAKLDLDLAATQTNFMGDKEKMAEVLVNLIENALKFSREGAPLNIQISTRDADDFIEVAVKDNGIGIEKGYLEKIFNKFYQIEDTLTRKTGGVGLGLAIIKEIIGNHHGRIWAESAGRNKGTTFIFTVPMAEKV